MKNKITFLFALAWFIFPAAGQSQEAKTIIPPITSPATNEYHPGKFIWADLVTREIDLVSTFYGEVLGGEMKNLYKNS